jgi:hypothetical protein
VICLLCSIDQIEKSVDMILSVFALAWEDALSLLYPDDQFTVLLPRGGCGRELTWSYQHPVQSSMVCLHVDRTLDFLFLYKSAAIC